MDWLISIVIVTLICISLVSVEIISSLFPKFWNKLCLILYGIMLFGLFTILIHQLIWG